MAQEGVLEDDGKQNEPMGTNTDASRGKLSVEVRKGGESHEEELLTCEPGEGTGNR